MGFYAKHGLDVEVVKTAGWAVIRDKTLNKEYDAAHMLSPMPLAITLGAGSTAVPYTMPAVENINGQAITLGDQAQGQARPEDLEGLQVRGALRLLDAQLPAALLRGRARPRPGQRHPDPRRAAAGDGGQPARRQHRRLPRRPTRSTSARCTTASASSTCCRRRSGTAIPAAPSPRRREFVTTMPNTYRGAAQGHHRRHRLRAPRPRTARRSPRRSRRPNYLNQPLTVVEQVLTGTFADGLGNVQRCPTASTSIRSPGTPSRSGS